MLNVHDVFVDKMCDDKMKMFKTEKKTAERELKGCRPEIYHSRK